MNRLAKGFAVFLAVSLFLALGHLTAGAAEERAGDILVENPYALARPGAARAALAYLVLHNVGAEADRLVGASSPLAERVEIRGYMWEGYAMRPRRLDAIVVAAGKSVELKPRGLHLRLVGLAEPPAPGMRVPLRLAFERGGVIEVAVEVRGIGTGTGGG